MKQFAKYCYKKLTKVVPASCLKPERYVMISGCPRSGTSACLFWMDSHPKTATFYETRMPYAVSNFCDAVNRYQKLEQKNDMLRKEIRRLFLRDAASQKWTGGRMLVLKEPVQATAFETVDQLAMLRNIQSVFEPLTIVLMVRHPVNVLNSMLKRTWGGSIVGVEPAVISLERGVAAWKNAAALSVAFQNDEKVVDVFFEDFVQSPKETAAKVAKAIGLEGTFVVDVRKTADISLSEDQVNYILDETIEERSFFGYSEKEGVRQ